MPTAHARTCRAEAALVRPRGVASPATGVTLTEDELTTRALEIEVGSDQLVAFGDGMESDLLRLTYGQKLHVGVARERLRLVR